MRLPQRSYTTRWDTTTALAATIGYRPTFSVAFLAALVIAIAVGITRRRYTAINAAKGDLDG